MAITSISRIQQRRGKKNSGTGLPQLASGELAWCIDSQELFIGNGSVSEGSPAVGNTKLLTYKDFQTQGALINLVTGVYKNTDSTISTGSSANFPTVRTLQAKLDERVSVYDFGAIGNGTTDDTIALQRAINQLFLNQAVPAYIHTERRISLYIPAGVYNITSTLYIPSFATLIGDGSDKTIINHSGSNTVIRFVNDMSTIGHPAGMGSTVVDANLDGNPTNDPDDVQYTNQPRHINCKGFSVMTSSSNQIALQLDTVRDSKFDDLIIQGNWGLTYDSNSKGIALNAFSTLVTCERNIFRNIKISGFSYAIYAKQDIMSNSFESGYITDVRQGIVLGDLANGFSIGELYGPRNTHINNYKFYNVKQHAIYIGHGDGNITNNIELYNVGNDGSSNTTPLYPQIFFNAYGNTSKNIKSDRSNTLSMPDLTMPYMPEVGGQGSSELLGTYRLTLGECAEYTSLFRLPVSRTSVGLPAGTISHTLNYCYKSINFNFSRTGTMTISADVESGRVQLVDDYNYLGYNNSTESLKLDFTAYLLDYIGATYTGATGQVPHTINIMYNNPLVGDAGYLHYTYSTII